jgi:hypothetical protein
MSDKEAFVYTIVVRGRNLHVRILTDSHIRSLFLGNSVTDAINMILILPHSMMGKYSCVLTLLNTTHIMQKD